MRRRIQIRNGTAAEWAAANPILRPGELGLETDTGRIKAGLGSAAYNDLPESTVNAAYASVGIEYSSLGTEDIAGNDTDTLFGVYNNTDHDMRIRIKAGATANYRAYFDWRHGDDVDEVSWLMGVNREDTFILYDSQTPCHRLMVHTADGSGSAGMTFLSSIGTSAVRINDLDALSGTGGLRVFAGGVAPRDEWAAFNGAKNVIQGTSGDVALLLRTSTTDSTNQVFRTGLRHFTAAEEPVGVLYAESVSGINRINIGGGSGALNAATDVIIYVASGATTITGTAVAKVTTRGLVLAEAGVGTQDASSLLELTSTTKGLLFPRMTTANRDAIASPVAGLVVFNTTTGVLNFHNGATWGAV